MIFIDDKYQDTYFSCKFKIGDDFQET